MANTRLYLVRDDGERMLVAKAFGAGWSWRVDNDSLIGFTADHDVDASYCNVLRGPTTLRLVAED